MKERGHVLELIGSKSAPPKLQTVLKQTRGIYLVEFHWFNKEGENNHHVVAVNCGLRVVFCNTLGALPFTRKKREYNGDDGAPGAEAAGPAGPCVADQPHPGAALFLQMTHPT